MKRCEPETRFKVEKNWHPGNGLLCHYSVTSLAPTSLCHLLHTNLSVVKSTIRNSIHGKLGYIQTQEQVCNWQSSLLTLNSEIKLVGPLSDFNLVGSVRGKFSQRLNFN